jgi:hypothetical protein
MDTYSSHLRARSFKNHFDVDLAKLSSGMTFYRTKSSSRLKLWYKSLESESMRLGDPNVIRRLIQLPPSPPPPPCSEGNALQF